MYRLHKLKLKTENANWFDESHRSEFVKQVASESYELHFTIPKSTVDYLQRLRNTMKMREVGGSLSYMLHDPHKLLIPDMSSFSEGQFIHSDHVGTVNFDTVSFVVFHTHPDMSYLYTNSYMGWPSGGDFVNTIHNHFYKNLLAHLVISKEGIYILSVHPAWQSYMRLLMDMSQEHGVPIHKIIESFMRLLSRLMRFTHAYRQIDKSTPTAIIDLVNDQVYAHIFDELAQGLEGVPKFDRYAKEVEQYVNHMADSTDPSAKIIGQLMTEVPMFQLGFHPWESVQDIPLTLDYVPLSPLVDTRKAPSYDYNAPELKEWRDTLSENE